MATNVNNRTREHASSMALAQNQSLSPVSLVGLLTIVCLLLLLHSSSTGVLRTAGEDEDSGSGFGGTGRNLVPGNDSGVGGTGVRPFLGYVENVEQDQADDTVHEVQVLLTAEPGITPVVSGVSLPNDALQPSLDSPIARSINIQLSDPYSEGAGSIHISEAIQQHVDSNALTINRESIKQIAQADLDKPEQVAESAVVAESAAQNSLQAGSSALNWANLAEALEKHRETANLEENPTSGGPDVVNPQERSRRPQNIQRPVLPPLQRVRPVQRAGLLPPPIRPLRL